MLMGSGGGFRASDLQGYDDRKKDVTSLSSGPKSVLKLSEGRLCPKVRLVMI